jgi:AAA-like domain
MKKRFNVTGVCYPEQHYMADTSAKFARIMDMVEQGDYFTINRPRQYGKTTTLFRLVDALKKKGDYVVFRTSFEGVGDAVFESESTLAPMFFRRLAQYMQNHDKTLSDHLQAASLHLDSLETLSRAITDLVARCGKKVVVFIDEVDKSSNNQLFVSFLGMLRDKYLERSEAPTFHSVVLTGVHDVKSLKIKLRPDEEKKYNSPWNIAADFKVDMNLQPSEIVPMLQEYAQDRGVVLDPVAVAERLFYYTSGYPFLVSKLCKIFDEDLLAEKTDKTWTTHDVDVAASQLLREDNTNFQELTKNLENNKELYELTLSLVVNEQDFPFDLQQPTINLGVVYGIFTDRNGLAIHNRIYHEVIASYMTSSLMVKNRQMPTSEFAGSYLLPGNCLDVKKAMRKFQELMKTEYSQKERDFLERQGRLVFLAFLKPILNGHGHAFKEPQISEEKRLDILITYHQHQYVIELKLWRGQTAHEAGLDQLTDYLDRLGLDEGFLLIFDPRVKKDWKSEEISHRDKRIFAVWV